MKKVSFDAIPFVPASHEDKKDPANLRKILLSYQDLIDGRIQMVNWARLLPKRKFASHYHEDMEELFLLISGRAKIIVDGEEEIMRKGDVVIVPIGAVHTMENVTDDTIEYIVIGISLGENGKTIIVEKTSRNAHE
ncbi:cupin domain-containing protein [Candidatus Gottesmanbacteria bacterium]|nr:cupin domain-containing protein [Candidatus Gottesmanbacteria bacterium]